MIFCIGMQLFGNDTFLIGGKKLLFGMCSSVIFSPRTLAFANIPRIFFLLFLLQENAFPENAEVYCLEYVIIILTSSSWHLFC